MVSVFKINFRLLCMTVVMFTGLYGECLANGAGLSFVPGDEADPGSFSLVIDKAEKIAGMKLTISYNKELLVFKKAEKTEATSSFLHVVNDKKPGQLIIVMASAKGVSGVNMPLLQLVFEKSASGVRDKYSVTVTQVQLMTEDLKEVKANNPEYLF